MAEILLEMRNITKTFPGVKALDNVNLKVEKGEIHALVGENGEMCIRDRTWDPRHGRKRYNSSYGSRVQGFHPHQCAG